jgi:AraC-like DNA-binding protein
MKQDIVLTNQYFTDINPLFCGQESCCNAYGFGPVAREYYLIYYIVSGKGIFKTEKGTYNLSQGDLFILRPHETSYYQADIYNPWTYIWIGFEYNLKYGSPKKFDVLEKDNIHALSCDHIFKSMLACENLTFSKEIYLCSKLYELFSFLMEFEYHAEKTDIHATYVDKAKNYIEVNYINSITVEDISKYLSIDRRYFCTIFKKQTKQSPKNYIVNLRLDKAALLLTENNYTPTQAAASTGYHDIINFSKMFKKKFGISPLYYKKSFTSQSPTDTSFDISPI